MKSRQLIIGIAVAFFVCVAGNVQGEWITLDYPGSYQTWAYGIDGSNIVGGYRLPGEQDPEKGHGFLYDGTSWITLDYPGSYSTCAYGIDESDIVGSYYNWQGDWPLRPFLYDGTACAWGTLPVRGWAYKMDGTNIVGTYQEWSWMEGRYYSRGFLLQPPYDAASVITIHYPGASDTGVYGIDGSNIVGTSSFPFLFDGVNWTLVPGDYPLDIDGNMIVGSCGTSGFLYDGTTWTWLFYPGSSWTAACGIDGDRIVGWYRDALGITHGFLYQPDVVIPATIDMNPNTISLRGKVKWMTCYIEFPSDYLVADIDLGTVKLNDEISAESGPSAIGDYDSDSIEDLMVKFDMSAVRELLQVGEVQLTVGGKLLDETRFEGSDTITVINPAGGE